MWFKIILSLDKFKLVLGNRLRFSSEDLLHAVHKSLGSQRNSLLCDWREFLDIAVRQSLVFSWSNTVVGSHSNGVRLISEFTEVGGFNFGLGEGESRFQIVSDSSLISKCRCGKRSLWVLVIGVDDGIPNSVEFIGSIVALNWNHISTFISIWQILGVSITCMKRLVDITIVVDQKSQSHRFTLFLWLNIFHNSLVGYSILDVIPWEPFENIWHSHWNVLSVVSDVDISLLDATTKERLVIEVPVGLPTTSASFIVVRESDALNERIVFLMRLG